EAARRDARASGRPSARRGHGTAAGGRASGSGETGCAETLIPS
ncbi:MAG: hypothetical protein JWM27_3812, partial [Gemmatimonadetes bacterium]|nr:hypothetical protein [Gemmatimonadota bacterium]